MKGKHRVVIETKNETITLELKRKYTIIKGESGVGKSLISTLFDKWSRSGGNTSSVKIISNVRVVSVRDFTLLVDAVDNRKEGIIFMDEDCTFVHSKGFSSLVKDAIQYFIICSRKDIKSLPYSLCEIYSLSWLHHKGRRSYTGTVPYFSKVENPKFAPDYVIVEDSGSGFKFYTKAFKNSNVLSAKGNSNIFPKTKRLIESGKNNILVIIDGAAGGSHVENLIRLQIIAEKRRINFCILSPESFEYLILRSKIYEKFGISKELDKTYDYCESSEYLSWEDYYTARLTELSRVKGIKEMEYSKGDLSPYYLCDNLKKIMSVLEREG